MTKKYKETYDKARLTILNAMLSFPTISGDDWVSCSFRNDVPVIGDLVSLQCAPVTKWQLSWYMGEERETETSFKRYLLSSIEDREECWWTNVGFSVYRPRHGDGKIPDRFRWTDRQYDFNKKVQRVCYDMENGVIRSDEVRFGNGFEADISFYKRFGLDMPWRYGKKFQDFRKVTISDIALLYNLAVKDGERKHGRAQENIFPSTY